MDIILPIDIPSCWRFRVLLPPCSNQQEMSSGSQEGKSVLTSQASLFSEFRSCMEVLEHPHNFSDGRMENLGECGS